MRNKLHLFFIVSTFISTIQINSQVINRNFSTFKNQDVVSGASLEYNASISAVATLDFSATANGYINLNTLADDLTDHHRSVFMWVKAPLPGSDQMLFSINTASGGNVCLLHLGASELRIYDGNNDKNANFDLKNNTWHYVGYTYNFITHETKMYIDGVMVREYTNNQTLTADAQISLGQEFDGSSASDFFNGEMTEISVWDEILEPADITLAMHSKINASHPKYANLVGYYNGFSDQLQNDTVLKDISGKNNDGVVTNFTLHFTNVGELPNYDAIDWWGNPNWIKNGTTQVGIGSTFITTAGNDNYELSFTRAYADGLFNISNTWSTTVVENTEAIDVQTDEIICSPNQRTYKATTHKVAPITFSKANEKYITIDAVRDDLTASDRSVFMWIKAPENVTGSAQILFAINTAIGGNVSALQIGTDEHLEIYDGSSTHDSGVDLGDNAWHHVGYTYDNNSNTTLVYADGVLVDTIINDQDAEASDRYSLGQEYDASLTTGNYYDGLMTEVSIWKTVLIENDITAIMNAMVAPTNGQYSNLVAYYSFPDHGYNAFTLKDWSPNANDGVIYGDNITSTTMYEDIANFNSAGWFNKTWEKNGTEISNANNLSIWPFLGTDNYGITLERPFLTLTDDWNLTYNENITTHPQDVSVHENTDATFSVGAVAGSTYQWYQTWDDDEFALKNYSTAELGASDIRDVVVADGVIYVVTEQEGISVSRDNGQTWERWTVATKGLRSNFCKSITVFGDTIYIINGPSQSGYSYSRDGGLTFTAVAFTSMSDGGSTTTYTGTIGTIGNRSYLPEIFQFDTNGDLYAFCRGVKNNANSLGPNTTEALFKSTNLGLSFTSLTGADIPFLFPDNNNSGAKVMVVKDSKVALGSRGSGFAISTDGGETFNVFGSETENYNYNTARDFAFHGNYVYIVNQESNVFYKSDFTGTNITPIPLTNGQAESIIENDDKLYIYQNYFGVKTYNPITATYEEDYPFNSDDDVRYTDRMKYYNGLFYFVESDTGLYKQTFLELLEGETASDLTIANAQTSYDSNKYVVEVSKDGCSNFSDIAKLLVKTGDIVKPILESTTPADDATGVVIQDGTIFILDFNETIQKGSGTILFRNSANKNYLFTIDVTNSQVSVANDIATITLTNAQVTAINDLVNAGQTDFYIEVPKEAFTDLNDNTFAGVRETEWDITTSGPLTISWTGTTNTDWDTASNWSSNTIPTASDLVVINNTSNQPIVAEGTSALANNLTINSGATLTLNNADLTVNGDFNSIDNNALTANSGSSVIVHGTATGDITFKQDVLANTTYAISAPLANQTVLDYLTTNPVTLGSGTSPNQNVGLAFFNNNGVGWDYYVDGDYDGLNNDDTSDVMDAGRGFTTRLQNEGSIAFSGSINTTNQTRSINQNSNNFNLVGNPFTASLNFGSLFTTNPSSTFTEQTAWFWNQETNTFEPKTAFTSNDFEIAPVQAFFVSANQFIGSLNFDVSTISHQTSTFERVSNTNPEITIIATKGSQIKQSLVLYDNNATTGFDNGYDGSIFDGIVQDFEIYTEAEANSQGRKLGLQVLPNNDFANMVVPIGIKANQNDIIEFSSETINLPLGINVYIEDNVANTFTRIDEANTSYSVTLTNNLNGTGRFYLHTTTQTLHTNNVDLSTINIYQTNNKTLRITGNVNGTLKMYSLLGSEILVETINSNGEYNLTLPQLSTGVYIVNLESENGIISKKLIIK